MNPGPPDYNSGALTTGPRRLPSYHVIYGTSFNFPLGRETVVVLPTTVQTVIMVGDSTNDDTSKSQAGNINSAKGNMWESQAGNVGEHGGSGEQVFKCNKCDKSFNEKEELNKHRRTHLPEKRFECNQCGKCFRHKGNLNQHKITHTGIKAFKCNYCNRCFGHKGHLNEHKRIHTGERPFKCNQCNRSFSRAGILQQHKLTHSGEKPFNCNQCSKSFNRQGLLNQHLKTHLAEIRAGIVLLPSTIERLTMAQNSTNRNQAGNVDQHETAEEPALKSNHFMQKEYQDKGDITQTGENVFQCNRCSKCFSHKWHLDEHEKTHTGEEPFGCNLCGKSFRHKGNLNQHLILHSGEKAFKCTYCFKRFSHKGHLNEHRRIHTGEKPFRCNQCDKRFSRKSLLKQHEKTHAGEKHEVAVVSSGTAQPPIAYENSKSGDMSTGQARNEDKQENGEKTASHSVQFENLNHHERTHAAGKVFECNSCDMSFNLKEDFDEHLTAHTGDKNFKCNFCSKVFRHKGHLNEHKRIHTGEKPFKCNLCEKRFNRKALLKQHQRTHSRGKHDGAAVLLPPTVQTFIVSNTGDLCAGPARSENESEKSRNLPCLKCNKCDKYFRHKDDLDQHKRSHMQEKAFKCSYCFKRFGHKGHLNEHKRIHTGEKPYNCNQCCKRFHRKSILTQHLKTHARENSSKYNPSDQSLPTNQGHMETLIDVHTEVKSLNENQCKEPFPQTGNLPQYTTNGDHSVKAESQELLVQPNVLKQHVDAPSNCDDKGETLLDKEPTRTNITEEPCKYNKHVDYCPLSALHLQTVPTIKSPSAINF